MLLFDRSTSRKSNRGVFPMNRKIKSIRIKILFPVVILITVMSVIMGLDAYFNITDAIVAMGEDKVEMAAEAASSVIDSDLLEKIVPGSEQSPEYQTLISSMRKIQKEFNISYLYTLYTDKETVYYGVDADETDRRMAVGDTFELPYSELKSVFDGNKYFEGAIDYTEEDGPLITVYLPIKNKDNKVVGAIGCDYSASSVVEKIDNTVINFFAISILCIIAAFILLGFIVHNIMKGLKTVDNKIHELAHSDGDLTKKIEIHTGDELELIASNINLILEYICVQANIADKVAGGNLSIEVSPMSDKDLLANSLKRLVERNSDTLKGICGAVLKAKESSVQTENVSESLAQGSAEQADAIKQISASVNDIAEKSGQNASDAKAAADMIMLIIDKVENGNIQMEQMVNAMENINKASKSISKVIKTIDDIAFQTNILSLNASIEAAKAGKYGKGFGVVAGEIKNLADKSSRAVYETSVLIENSIKITKEGSYIADKTAASLKEIKISVNESEKTINKITGASDSQKEAIARINEVLEQIANVIEANSHASRQCAEASAELSSHIDVINKKLSAYKF